jgi:hypothetical protein
MSMIEGIGGAFLSEIQRETALSHFRNLKNKDERGTIMKKTILILTVLLTSILANAAGDSTLGKFGELSIPTKELKSSVEFWQGLGFKTLHSAEAPYPFAILTDGQIKIGLHETNLFNEKALTYYSTNAVERVQQLKSEGYHFEEEWKYPDGTFMGASLRSPEGQLILIMAGDISGQENLSDGTPWTPPKVFTN